MYNNMMLVRDLLVVIPTLSVVFKRTHTEVMSKKG